MEEHSLKVLANRKRDHTRSSIFYRFFIIYIFEFIICQWGNFIMLRITRMEEITESLRKEREREVREGEESFDLRVRQRKIGDRK